MYRICGACKKKLRWDEPLTLTWLDGAPEGPGRYVCCPRCIARQEGVETPPARKYPEGQVPRHPYRDDDLPVCALCREALFEGERTEAMRLVEEDVAGTDTVAGCYCSCPRCIARWQPVIRNRLVRLEVIPEAVLAADVQGNLLL